MLNLLREDAEATYGHYEDMLGDDVGLARELARMNLTLNTYTQWYWRPLGAVLVSGLVESASIRG